MQVMEDAARRMLIGVGFSRKALLEAGVVEKKISTLDSVADQLKEPEKEEDKLLRDQILAARANGEEINIVRIPGEDGVSTMSEKNGTDDSATVAAAEKPAKVSKPKPDKTKNKGKKSDKPKDEWGSILGSQASKINAVLALEAKPATAIAEESGCSASRVNGHLQWLLKKEFIVRDGKNGLKRRARKPSE